MTNHHMKIAHNLLAKVPESTLTPEFLADKLADASVCHELIQPDDFLTAQECVRRMLDAKRRADCQYDLTRPCHSLTEIELTIHGSPVTNLLRDKVRHAGYANVRSFLDNLGLWVLPVGDVLKLLDEMSPV